jgi:hypothetical protein
MQIVVKKNSFRFFIVHLKIFLSWNPYPEDGRLRGRIKRDLSVMNYKLSSVYGKSLSVVTL